MQRQGTFQRSGYFPLLIVMAIAALLSLAAKAEARERWRPGRAQFEIRDRVQDCSVYRSVLSGNKAELSDRVTNLKETLQAAHLQFDTLEQCARTKGVVAEKGINNEENELKAAEACPDEYNAWVNEGKNLALVEEDVKELNRQIGILKGVVRDHCTPIVLAQQ